MAANKNITATTISGGSTSGVYNYSQYLKDIEQKAAAERDASYALADQLYSSSSSSGAYNKAISAYTDIRDTGLTYAEAAKQSLMDYATQLRDITYASAAETRAQDEKNAELARQRSIVDARTSYEQNKASYGANAEALADMGLSASGYSDYINSQAYATQRSEIQNANATAETAKRNAEHTERQAKLGADQQYLQGEYEANSTYDKNVYDINTTYAQNILAAEQEKAKADSSAYTAALQAKAAADEKYNSQIESGKDTYAQKYGAIMEAAKGGDYTKTEILNLAKMYGLSTEDANSLANSAISKTSDLYESLKEEILNASSDPTIDYGTLSKYIQLGYQDEGLTYSEYNKLKTQWNDGLDTSENAFYENGSLISPSSAEAKLNEVINSPLSSDATKKAIKNSFDNLYMYRAKQNGTYYYSGSKNLANIGEMFTVKTENGYILFVASGGEINDKKVISASNNFDDGAVFEYTNDLYVVKKDSNGKNHVYKIRKRWVDSSNDYTKLKNSFGIS